MEFRMLLETEKENRKDYEGSGHVPISTPI